MATLTEEQLDGYLNRIGYSGIRPPRATLETLKELQMKQVASIPWENLTLHHPATKAVNERILTDLDTVYNKLVTRRRGGYCMEQGKLTSAALRTLGFKVYDASARVVPPPVMATVLPDTADEIPLFPASHHLIFVAIGDDTWICDTGFGANCLREPIPLRACDPSETEYTGGPLHRVRRGYIGKKEPLPADAKPKDVFEAATMGWYLQRYMSSKDNKEPSGWTDMYYFTESLFTEADFRMQNWYTSTSPDSPFVNMLLMAQHTPTGRVTLVGRQLRIHTELPGVSDTYEERILASDEELDAALKEHFGIEF